MTLLPIPPHRASYFHTVRKQEISAARCTFPTIGFVELPAKDRVEEETIPGYDAEDFYPVELGQVFNDQYQVLVKLGRGVDSTAWLARNLPYVSQFLILFLT